MKFLEDRNPLIGESETDIPLTRKQLIPAFAFDIKQLFSVCQVVCRATSDQDGSSDGWRRKFRRSRGSGVAVEICSGAICVRRGTGGASLCSVTIRGEVGRVEREVAGSLGTHIGHIHQGDQEPHGM